MAVDLENRLNGAPAASAGRRAGVYLNSISSLRMRPVPHSTDFPSPRPYIVRFGNSLKSFFAGNVASVAEFRRLRLRDIPARISIVPMGFFRAVTATDKKQAVSQSHETALFGPG